MAILHELISVFGEVRRLVAREDNNFDWSCWEDSTDALVEVDQILNALRGSGLLPDSKMAFLFLPTGPLQEVSISSGWGDNYIELANRFDAAMAGTECSCFKSTSHCFQFFGETREYAEVSLFKCSRCGQDWLRFFYENEAFSGSGRWFIGAITAEQTVNLTVETARSILEGLKWYWYGGSNFSVQNGITSGEIRL